MSKERLTRRRGVVLTNLGWQKLQAAKRKAEIWDNEGIRYTFEELSQRSGLAPITVAKILNREAGVDKQSLILCFSAFNLVLIEEDYTRPSDRSLQIPTTMESQAILPTGWFVSGSRPSDYDIRLDTAVAYSGSASALLQSKSLQADGFCTLMQMFKASRYRDRRLQLSGYLKTEAIQTWAGLWMRVDDANNRILSFDNMQNRSVTGTTPWTQYAVVLDVPVQSDRIAFGFLLAGAGRVWCDHLQFATVGLETPVTAHTADSQIPTEPSNLDFEQGSDE